MKKTTTTPPKPKKEKWLKIIACVNTDIAPKWFKAKIKEVQKDGNLSEEQATKFLLEYIDNYISEKFKRIDITKEMFLTNNINKKKG